MNWVRLNKLLTSCLHASQLLLQPNSCRRVQNSDLKGFRDNECLEMTDSIDCFEEIELDLPENDSTDAQNDRQRSLSYKDPDANWPLVFTKTEIIDKKDFVEEVRASADVANYLKDPVVLLDIGETSVDGVLDAIIRKLFDKIQTSENPEDVKQTFYSGDTVKKLAKTLQGAVYTEGGGVDLDQSWLCLMSSVPSIQKRHVALAKLRRPINMGATCQEVFFLILILTPIKEKGTKNDLETGRTFSTLFSDVTLRTELSHVTTEEEFLSVFRNHVENVTNRQELKLGFEDADEEVVTKTNGKCFIGQGVIDDLKRRLPLYRSDFTDGILGRGTIHKTTATTVFLYFSILLPSIALGMLNDNNTNGKIDVQKVIYSQTFGGLIFALFSGQPMTIIMTTAPLALFTKVIYVLSKDWGVDFFAMYALVGIWNGIFLVIYALLGLSRIMKWSTRSTEEVFATFISVAFIVDPSKDIYNNFMKNYYNPACKAEFGENVTSSVVSIVSNITSNVTKEVEEIVCKRENSLLFLLLMLGTLWLGYTLFTFNKTPFLNASKREILADYALPTSVIVMSFVGSYIFRDVKLIPFNADRTDNMFSLAPLGNVNWVAIIGSLGLGFCLSLLFFMDQNISSAMVNAPDNKLKKGCAYNWDLLVVAAINVILTLFGMPMVHGALPHSPLHARAMADVEDYVQQGHVYQRVVKARETRVTGLLSHILIGLSLLMLPYPLSFIPRAVLDGLFLYLSVNALTHIQLFERLLLLVTEQAAYPPHHYIQRVPQRKIHFFTLAQVIQLLVMCAFGFSPFPYLKMTFPVLLLVMLPVRHKLVPTFIEKRYLDAMDG